MGTKFAVVRDKNSKEILRVIDLADDPDDSHMDRARNNLQSHEEMFEFKIADHPVRNARTMKTHLP